MAQPKQHEIVENQVFEVAKEDRPKKRTITAQEASALVATIKGKMSYLKTHKNKTEEEALKKLLEIAKEYGLEIEV